MEAYYYPPPNESNAERLVSEALMASQVPGPVLQELVRPPLPQIQEFRERFGYPGYAERQLGVRAVLNAGRLYPDARSQTSGSYTGSSRNFLPAVGF